MFSAGFPKFQNVIFLISYLIFIIFAPLSREFLKLFDDREATITKGIVFLNEQYDVHRFHPPLIYGRRGDSAKGEGEGIALCKVRIKI